MRNAPQLVEAARRSGEHDDSRSVAAPVTADVAQPRRTVRYTFSYTPLPTDPPAPDAEPDQEFADAYAAALRWVAWNARRRWPDHPTNDDVWALSVAAWEVG